MIKNEKIKVKLLGSDGNAFAVLGACQKAMIKEGASKEEIDTFLSEAMKGDYDHLLQTCMKYFDVE